MTAVTPPPAIVPAIDAAPTFEAMLELWLLPVRMTFSLMETSLGAMASARAAGRSMAPPAEEKRQEIARAAEDAVAQIDDQQGETIVTPAALVA